MNEALAIPGYKIERMIARGGMAEVYLAEQTSLGRKVALKVLDNKSTDTEFTQRFLQEAKLVASLNHTNLITIFDFGSLADGRLYLVMELLTGGDLEERLQKKITSDVAIKIMRQLVSVLHFVHSKGIVHRDVKPANILFREDGTLVLTDFGIAKKIDNNVGLTHAGMMIGSPAYSSPEQVQGLEIDRRADIYSAGVVFLELLTGNNPFKAETFVDTAIKHMQLEIPRLAGNDGRFQFVLDKMLAKKPRDRYNTLDEVAAMLDQVSTHIAGTRSGINPAVTPAALQSALQSGAFKDRRATPVNPLTTDRITHDPAHKKNSENDLDDLLNEALKEFEGDNFTPPSRTPASKTNTDHFRSGYSGSYRNRPLPSILMDDGDENLDAPTRRNRPPPVPRPPVSRSPDSGSFRTRPLPSNLLDDDEVPVSPRAGNNIPPAVTPSKKSPLDDLLDDELRKLDDEL